MPDINDLGIPDEAMPEIDYDAPEPGAFPPPIAPGTYEFLFKLPEEAANQFDVQEIKPPTDNPGKYLQVNFNPEVLRDSQGNAVPAREDGTQPRLTFQRASAYRHPKMQNSGLADLIRGLGQRIEGPFTPSAVAALLRSIDGRATFIADVAWRMYCKTCQQTVSTAARTKKGEAKWPKNAEGHYESPVACPGCNAKGFGNAEIVRIKLPKGGA